MEFPPSDPPPSNFVQTPNFSQASNFTQSPGLLPPVNFGTQPQFAPTSSTQTVVPNSTISGCSQPSYQEMIMSAIIALNDKNGSSRQAIAKYIENEYKVSHLPSHSWELTQELRRMKNSGQLVLVRHSYMLPEINNSPQPHTTQAQRSDVSQRRAGHPSQLQQSIPSPGVSSGLQPKGGPFLSSGPSTTPVGFAAFSNQGQLRIGVPTTPLFGAFTSSGGASQFGGGGLQFGGGGYQTNAQALGGLASNVQTTMAHVGGSVSNVRSIGPMTGSAAINDAQTIGLPLSNVPTMGHIGGSQVVGSVGRASNDTTVSNSQVIGGFGSNVATMDPIERFVSNAPPQSLIEPVSKTAATLSNAQTNGLPASNVHVSESIGNVRGPNGMRSNDQTIGGYVSNAPRTDLIVGTGGNVSQTIGGPLNNTQTLPPLRPQSDSQTMSPVGGPVNYSPTMRPIGGSVSKRGSVLDSGLLAPIVPREQINDTMVGGVEQASVEDKVENMMVGAEHESVGHVIVSSGLYSAAQNNDGLPSEVLGKRGRGRPPKVNTMVPMVNGGLKGSQESRKVRPRKLVGSSTRPRGRPRKIVVDATVSVDGAATETLPEAAKEAGSDILPAKPLGRPKKHVETATLTSEMQLLAYQGLKARLAYYQSRIKAAVSIVKPYLNETATTALEALQDLEDLANKDILSVPVSVQGPPVNVQKAPADGLNSPNVESAAAGDLETADPSVEDAAPENIQHIPSTAEGAPPTSTADTALVTPSAAAPVEGVQETPIQS